jgi:hypothetical protein
MMHGATVITPRCAIGLRRPVVSAGCPGQSDEEAWPDTIRNSIHYLRAVLRHIHVHSERPLAKVRTSCASVNKILIVSSMNSRSGMVRGSATCSGSWDFRCRVQRTQSRIRSSHLFQRTFAPSGDDDLVAFPVGIVSAKPRPMPEPPPVIKIVFATSSSFTPQIPCSRTPLSLHSGVACSS